MSNTTSSDESSDAPFPLYLSPSQINGLLMCVEQFRLTRLLHVPERPMWASIGGSAVHKITEILDYQKWEADNA